MKLKTINVLKTLNILSQNNLNGCMKEYIIIMTGAQVMTVFILVRQPLFKYSVILVEIEINNKNHHRQRGQMDEEADVDTEEYGFDSHRGRCNCCFESFK